jgi:hypothetical protein
MEKWMERYNIVANIDRSRYFDDCEDSKYAAWTYLHPSVSPQNLSARVFRKTVTMLGSDEQVSEIIP